MLALVSKLFSLPSFGALDEDKLEIVVFSSSEIVGDGVESKKVVLSGSAEDEIDEARLVLSSMTDPRMIVNVRCCNSYQCLSLFHFFSILTLIINSKVTY